MNILIGIAFVGILGALIFAGISMVKDSQKGQAKTTRMAKALAWRVGLSLALFLIILFSYRMGWISPTGLPTA
jgi:TRAP-type C4-dicarboxylate transport system permease large subunit